MSPLNLLEGVRSSPGEFVAPLSGQLPKMLPAYGGHDIRLHLARFADIPSGMTGPLYQSVVLFGRLPSERNHNFEVEADAAVLWFLSDL